MSEKAQSEIDFEGLKKFLKEIGFKSMATLERSLAFSHAESGTIVTLTVPDDGNSVRSSDLNSILFRLEHLGLLEESQLEQLQNGKLPLAS